MHRPTMCRLGLLLLCLGLAGCAGPPAPTAPSPIPPAPDQGTDRPHPRAHEHGSERRDKHEHQFRGDLKLYHDLMSALWHTEPGQQRIASTCDAVATLNEHGAAIAKSPPPAGSEGQPEAWTAAAQALADQTAALAAACEEPGRPRVEPVFTVVHDAFHDLMVVVGDQKATGG